MFKLEKSKLNELFDKISSTMALYVPTEKNNSSSFEKWNGQNAALDLLNTDRPTKTLFFPQSENLVSFKTSGKNIEIFEQAKSDEKFVIYGVRACDAKSIENVLDRVFLSDPVDEFYKARRDNSIIITAACGEPEETCFCSVFGIDAAECGFGDITSYTVGDTVYLKGNTEKGNELLASLSDTISAADNSDEETLSQYIVAVKEIFAQLPLADLDLNGFDGNATAAKFNSPKWEELASGCIGCGTCTFVCPTCQCYDIRDFDTGHGVQRYRCWDSCMYSDFTLMAHGNPRKSQTEKFRQRFMHKLVYFPANNDGEYSCVGCGRCLAKCPVSMNIVKVIKSV